MLRKSIRLACGQILPWSLSQTNVTRGRTHLKSTFGARLARRESKQLAHDPPLADLRGLMVVGAGLPLRSYELHESIEQPARVRAHSGRFAAKLSRPGCSV